jgi:hypothetical protein
MTLAKYRDHLRYKVLPTHSPKCFVQINPMRSKDLNGLFYELHLEHGEITVSETLDNTRLPRWRTRKETMAHGRIGSTRMNELLQAQKFTAKKVGRKVLVDLNSFDAYVASLPNVGAV